jgi:DnaJ-class molecular chaperone
MATTRDYYDILGISKSASAQEIKSAYRKAALKYHPDRNKEAGAENKFKEINEAYEVLSNEEKRRTYDQFGKAAFQNGGMGGGDPFGGGFRQQGPFTYTYSSSGGNPFEGFDFGGQGFSDPFDIFESFFGGQGRRAPQKQLYGIEISFLEAVHGVEKDVTINGARKTIKIPPGVDNGNRIRFADYDVQISVRPDSRFRREGYDLFVDVNVPFYIAILGGDITVPTIDGDLKMKIRGGTQPNTMIRLREQGVTRLQQGGRGDQYVRVVITLPEKLSAKEREALRVFEK